MVQTGHWGQGCVDTRSSPCSRGCRQRKGLGAACLLGAWRSFGSRDRGRAWGLALAPGNTATGEVHRSSPADLVLKERPQLWTDRARPAGVIPGEPLVGAGPAPRAVVRRWRCLAH